MQIFFQNYVGVTHCVYVIFSMPCKPIKSRINYVYATSASINNWSEVWTAANTHFYTQQTHTHIPIHTNSCISAFVFFSAWGQVKLGKPRIHLLFGQLLPHSAIFMLLILLFLFFSLFHFVFYFWFQQQLNTTWHNVCLGVRTLESFLILMTQPTPAPRHPAPPICVVDPTYIPLRPSVSFSNCLPHTHTHSHTRSWLIGKGVSNRRGTQDN